MVHWLRIKIQLRFLILVWQPTWTQEFNSHFSKTIQSNYCELFLKLKKERNKKRKEYTVFAPSSYIKSHSINFYCGVIKYVLATKLPCVWPHQILFEIILNSIRFERELRFSIQYHDNFHASNIVQISITILKYKYYAYFQYMKHLLLSP